MSKGDARSFGITDFATAQAVAHLQAKGYAVITPGRLRTVKIDRTLDMSAAPQDEQGAGAFFLEWVLAGARELAEAMVQAGVFVVGRKPGHTHEGGTDVWELSCTTVGPTPDVVQANLPPSTVKPFKAKPKTKGGKARKPGGPARVLPMAKR